jgi:hypothetical protein
MTQATETQTWTARGAAVFEGARCIALTTTSDVPNRAQEEARARMMAAAPELLGALKALKLQCLADPLNPCWDNRPADKPGLHWGSENDRPIRACSSCNARAAIAKAEGI